MIYFTCKKHLQDILKTAFFSKIFYNTLEPVYKAIFNGFPLVLTISLITFLHFLDDIYGLQSELRGTYFTQLFLNCLTCLTCIIGRDTNIS